MAVTGKFLADFASFEAAAASAETKLVSFESGASKVVASIERLENSLSGKKLIQEATLAAQAVENIGGATMLTDEELQRLGATADEAIEKMIRMGVDVPPNLKAISDAAREAASETGKLGEAAGTATPKASGLAGALKQFDGILGAMGLNIGPIIRGVEEIGLASGKTIGELGKLQTAGLTLGAGLAGWGIGRAISGFFDLDKKIGDATAKLLGWGDVAGQEAAVKADVLAKATANAGRQITNMAEAIEINRKAVESKLSPPVVKAAFDIQKMREEMLKAEAARVVNPEAITNVVKLGQVAAEAGGKLSILEAKLNNIERLNASISSRLEALNADLDRSAAERNADFNTRQSSAITQQIVGQVSPLNERDRTNVELLDAMIARLTRETAEFKLPAFLAPGGVGFDDAGRRIRDAAQQNANNLAQLSYLQSLKSLTVNVNVSGVWNPAEVRTLGNAIGNDIMTKLSIGRQLGTG